MNLLLDTHALLWALGDPARLGARAGSAIRDGRNTVYVSPASIWEIEIKRALGRLEAPDELLDEIAIARFSPLLVTLEHAHAAGRLPSHQVVSRQEV